ncbi:unnamed protein product [Brachionus calyciflorus]|uniref:DDE-1 domain-containing protein n=1 Tax=Brachionus calyciflorus TaxID=104777 RepID=A0A814EDI2_9BILA|nr:unnamed protein product [Brachionus calyciflorus]
MICDYANTVLFDYMRNNGLDDLFFDSVRCHKTSLVENTFRKLNIRLIFIPPRFTNLLQPADFCWFSSLKKAYTSKWNDWYLNGEKTYTKYGNRKSPGYVKCISWLQYSLHSSLNFILNNNPLISDYIDDIDESDDIDAFDTNDENFFENLVTSPDSSDSQESSPTFRKSSSSSSVVSTQQQTPLTSSSSSYSSSSSHQQTPLASITSTTSSDIASSSDSISDNRSHSQSNSLTPCTSLSSSRVNENITGKIIEINNSSSS